MIEKNFKRNRFAHFFLMLPNGLMEIRGASIHPTNDQERKTPPQGYFFVGRYWTQAILNELGELIGGTVRLETGLECQSPPNTTTTASGSLHVHHVFTDGSGQPVARAEALVLSPLVQQFTRSTHWFLIWISCVSGLLGLIFSLMMIRWVAAPLRKISDSLDTGDDVHITLLSRNQTEFGHIARLIKESLRQKEKLLSEVADRKRVEESLLASEERYRTILDNITDGYYEVDVNGNFTFYNDAMRNMLGYENAKLLGMNFKAYMDPENARKVFQTFHRVFLTGEPSKAFDWVIIHKDGAQCYINTSVSVIRDNKGNVTGFRGIARDITERKNAEEAMLRSQEQYRGVVENASDAIMVLQDGRIVFHNKKTETLSGYNNDELAATPFIHFVRQEDRPAVMEQYVQKMSGKKFGSAFTFRIIYKTGQEALVEFNATIVSWNGKPALQCFMRDVTLQTKLHAQLQQSHKLEAIGTLAGGIAHDFNNIIGIILGNAELAMRETQDFDPARKYLQTILHACDRAREVVLQILNFSSRTQQEKAPVLIGAIVGEALQLMKSSLPATIEIRAAIPKKPHAIMADPVQIHQAVINLCTNAAHAMKGKGGILSVTVAETQLDEMSAHPYADLSPGSYVSLSINDTGEGIAPEIIKRIFDPYFTTKKTGEGTGMGLSVVHGIIKNHGGAITVQSEIGKGTSFRILFPRIEAEPALETKTTEEPPAGKERILYVDDDLSLAEIGQEMLEYLGYQVVSKTSPVEALALFQTDPYAFDLVITDMTMPQMTGFVMAQEMIRIRPDIPVIMNTGYSDQIDETKASEAGIRAYIMKPLTAMHLAKTVRSVLDQKL
jgi:PAS domain S-box-containing protein